MAAAFVENPDPQATPQTNGPNAVHNQANASRFNDLNSRVGALSVGATVSDALAEFKAGTFTVENLRQLAFGMGYQIVEGKTTAELVAKCNDLEEKNGQLEHRATTAEAAFAAAKAELDATKAAKPTA